MKRIQGMAVVLLILLAVSSVRAYGADFKDDILAGIEKLGQNAKESREVTLDKNSLALADNKGDNPLISKMDFIVVRSYEFDAPGKYRMGDLDVVRKRAKDGGWSHLVSSHEAKEQTDIYTRTDQHGESTEMLIISAEEKELSIVHLKGRMSLKELSSMGSHYGGDASDTKLKHR